MMRKMGRLWFGIAFSFLLVACGNESSAPQPSEEGTGMVEPSPSINNNQVADRQGSENQVADNQSSDNQVAENKVIVQVNSSGNYGLYDMSGDFIDMIKNNPIDHAYQVEFEKNSAKEFFTTADQIDLELKYIELWDQELNAIYNKLKAQLNDKEKDMLTESQKGWLQHHLKESEFVSQTFYLRDEGPILGSQGRVQTQQAVKGRLRERTLELMEYYFMLGNNVEFMYTVQ